MVACEGGTEHLAASRLLVTVWNTLLDAAAPQRDCSSYLPGALDDGRCFAALLAEVVFQAGFLVAPQPCE